MTQRVVATVEARMRSSRLPGKAMKEIAGKPALELLLERLSRSREINDIVVATTSSDEDNVIQDLCQRLGYKCFRGPSEDVLHRVAAAAEWAGADLIAQITGDCVVTCPEITDLAIRTFRSTGCDYLSNLMVQTYPQAVDARVFRASDLQEIDSHLAGDDSPDREHPYLYFEEHGERYKLVNLYAPARHRRPEWRLDLDYQEDLELLRIIFGDLYPSNPEFGLEDLIAYLDDHQDLREINQEMPRKPLRQ